MGLFSSPYDQAKEDFVNTLSSKVIRKIADANGIDYYDTEEAAEGIVENMSLRAIQNYAKASTAQLGRGRLRVSENNVKKVINSWSIPKTFNGEKELKKHLARKLRERFGDEKVLTEAGDNRVDILVGDTYPIELKYNFSRSDIDRATSQLEREYREFREKVFFVLCGRKEDNGWPTFHKYSLPRLKKKIHLIVKSDKELEG